MLEGIKENIVKLISLYEAQKQRSDELSSELEKANASLLDSKEQIAQLKRQVDNLKLSSAFAGGADNALARERVDKLIAEIDKCIKYLQK